MSPFIAPITAPDYRVAFPDILEVSVPERPDSTGRFLVMPDGNVELGKLGNVFADGKTIAEITQKIAAQAGVPEGQVICRVSQHRSRVVHVFGPGGETPSTLPYAGTERVTDALNRAGLSNHQNLAEVRVIRRNTATGRPEENFLVDLTAIRSGDPQTNLILEPNDEIRLTETSPTFLTRTLPAWFKPENDH
ncbi:polysaccharide biosynthesis/export family protein [Zavarzinella formosa]|uniref:polysaccharide biosynthesis/export family protein n=1 Tax=Zavarzinella formosa TaxID=360055 RepID=UPI0002F3A4BA|nr:polysaccharide biosynthesis/export family protein [Zavarzinella formosa]